MAMVVVLWVTEALPLAVTAMLAPVLAVILRVAPARTAFASFADPVIFVFIGGFILAEGMFVHGVDRRIALTAQGNRACRVGKCFTDRDPIQPGERNNITCAGFFDVDFVQPLECIKIFG